MIGGANAGARAALPVGEAAAGAGILAQRVLRPPNIVGISHGKR